MKLWLYLSRTMETGVYGLIDENFLIPYISLKADPAKKEEAGLIEDQNQEYQGLKRTGKATEGGDY